MTATRRPVALVVALAVSGVLGLGLGAAWGLGGSIPAVTAGAEQTTGGGQEFAPGSVNETVFVGTELAGLLLTPEQIEGVVTIGDYYGDVENTFTAPSAPSECSVFDGAIDRVPAGYRQQYGASSDQWSVGVTWVRNEAYQFPTVADATARFDEIADLTASCNHYVGALNSIDDEATGDIVFGPSTEGEAPSLSGSTTIQTYDLTFARHWAIVRSGNVISYVVIGHVADAATVTDEQLAELVELIRSRAVEAAASVGSSDD